MRIVLNIEEEDIERIARSLDNQYAYTLARNLEDSGYKRLAELFRGLPKRGAQIRFALFDSAHECSVSHGSDVSIVG